MKWITRLKLKRISKYVMIFCLGFLLTLSAFTLYGDKVGNFVVVLKEDKKVRISACLTKDFEKDCTTHFSVPGVEKLDATTYSEIPDTVKDGVGVKNDGRGKFMAFSFYLLNRTENDIVYDIVVEVVDEVGGTQDKSYKPSDAMRVLLLEESELDGEMEGSGSLKEDGAVYARNESSQEGIDELAPAGYPEGKVISFVDEGKTIIADKEIPFAGNAVKKYTVVVWLEGYDISCKDELLGSKLKMRMSIEAYEK